MPVRVDPETGAVMLYTEWIGPEPKIDWEAKDDGTDLPTFGNQEDRSLFDDKANEEVGRRGARSRLARRRRANWRPGFVFDAGRNHCRHCRCDARLVAVVDQRHKF